LHEATKAPWILDEPASYWDCRALQYYGELTDQGLWVVSSWAFQHYRRLVTDRMERDGLKAWVYGSSNRFHDGSAVDFAAVRTLNRSVQEWNP
jgi:hypothetical protein